MRGIALFLVATAALPGPAGAQTGEVLTGSEETRTVAAGPQYEAGGFHRFWFGDGYRDLWTTPGRMLWGNTPWFVPGDGCGVVALLSPRRRPARESPAAAPAVPCRP